MTFEIVFNNDVLERSVVYVIVTLSVVSVVFWIVGTVVVTVVFVTVVVVTVVVVRVVTVVVLRDDVIVVLVVVSSVRGVRTIVREWGAVVVLRGGANFLVSSGLACVYNGAVVVGANVGVNLPAFLPVTFKIKSKTRTFILNSLRKNKNPVWPQALLRTFILFVDL